MRILAIIGALIAGLVGLFMSVCGGGFLLSMGNQLRNGISAGTVMLLLPAFFLGLGIIICRAAFQSMRRTLKDK